MKRFYFLIGFFVFVSCVDSGTKESQQKCELLKLNKTNHLEIVDLQDQEDFISCSNPLQIDQCPVKSLKEYKSKVEDLQIPVEVREQVQREFREAFKTADCKDKSCVKLHIFSITEELAKSYKCN